ncbi:rho guanine nucleotide exchange factor 1-like [Hypanus sabinus]|uniref:rho guanine nucleotide exchange factor 1-like n=1 Tax=Hypanus sabinus TaxID=79690 RepID=UPI0028C3BDD5|nr:rho guanine nucleotide exchange factor 1-like [Hypanus sabinus]
MCMYIYAPVCLLVCLTAPFRFGLWNFQRSLSGRTCYNLVPFYPVTGATEGSLTLYQDSEANYQIRSAQSRTFGNEPPHRGARQAVISMDTEDSSDTRLPFGRGASSANPTMLIIGAEDEEFENDLASQVDDTCSHFQCIDLLKDRPTYLIIFLHHVILQFDASSVLCYLHGEMFKGANIKDARRMFVDYFHMFLDRAAALRVSVPPEISFELDRCRPEMLVEESLRNIVKGMQKAMTQDIFIQLEDFRNKRMMGMTIGEKELSELDADRDLDRESLDLKEKVFAEQLLPKVEEATANSDDEKSTTIYNAVVTYMKYLGVKTKEPRVLEKKRHFLMRRKGANPRKEVEAVKADEKKRKGIGSILDLRRQTRNDPTSNVDPRPDSVKMAIDRKNSGLTSRFQSDSMVGKHKASVDASDSAATSAPASVPSRDDVEGESVNTSGTSRTQNDSQSLSGLRGEQPARGIGRRATSRWRWWSRRQRRERESSAQLEIQCNTCTLLEELSSAQLEIQCNICTLLEELSSAGNPVQLTHTAGRAQLSWKSSATHTHCWKSSARLEIQCNTCTLLEELSSAGNPVQHMYTAGRAQLSWKSSATHTRCWKSLAQLEIQCNTDTLLEELSSAGNPVQHRYTARRAQLSWKSSATQIHCWKSLAQLEIQCNTDTLLEELSSAGNPVQHRYTARRAQLSWKSSATQIHCWKSSAQLEIQCNTDTLLEELSSAGNPVQHRYTAGRAQLSWKSSATQIHCWKSSAQLEIQCNTDTLLEELSSAGNPVLPGKLGRSASLRTYSDRRRSHKGTAKGKQPRSRSDVDAQAAARASDLQSQNVDPGGSGGADGQPSFLPAQPEDSGPRVTPLETEPSNWRQLVSGEQLLRLRKSEVKRQEVINELFITEHAHVRMLKVLYEVFYQRMLAESILSETELQSIFPSLDELIEVHTTFYNNMKKLREDDDYLVTEIGETLLAMFHGTEGFWFKKLASRFCSVQSYALELIKGKNRKDLRFSQFIQDAQSNPQCRRLQLKDIIPIEMQRLTKYPLLLENIAKNTEEGVEKQRVLQVAECCRNILKDVNQEVRDMENLRRLNDYQRRLDITNLRQSTDPFVVELVKNLDLTQKRMDHEGPLVWRLTKEKAIDVHVLLLDDSLVLMQKVDDRMVLKCHSKNSSSTAEGKQLLCPIVKLGSVLARDVATDRKAFFILFHTWTGPQIYELVASTVSERRSWCDKIQSTQAALSLAKPSMAGRNSLVPTSGKCPPQSHGANDELGEWFLDPRSDWFGADWEAERRFAPGRRRGRAGGG